MSHLSFVEFQSVVRNTPLVAIDFIVKNEAGQVLLGKRANKPAQGFWFVPGGRILKDESMNDAFIRIVKVELGIDMRIDQAKFIGVFEHFYDDNFSGDDFTTHYVVLGYELELDLTIAQLPAEQHDNYVWLTTDEMLSSKVVHMNSKRYVDSSNFLSK